MNKNPLNNQQINEIISLYKTYGNYSEVGRRMNLTPAKVKQIINKEIKNIPYLEQNFFEMDYEDFYNNMFYCMLAREL
jgi:DNA invertase Pin-like site-specific DNA recombinase